MMAMGRYSRHHKMKRAGVKLPGMGGFSFVELLIALSILSVTAMLALPLGERMIQARKEHELRRALWEIREAIDLYKRAADQGRILLGMNASGYPPTLEVLVAGVIDQRSPSAQRLYFLRRLPADPMNDDAPAPAHRTWTLRSYAAPPDQPAEGADVFDVQSRSHRVGSNGVPYSQW